MVRGRMQRPGTGGYSQQTLMPSCGKGYDGSTGLWVGWRGSWGLERVPLRMKWTLQGTGATQDRPAERLGDGRTRSRLDGFLVAPLCST